jgi:hypothetical protein
MRRKENEVCPRNVSRVLSLHNYTSFFIPNTCSQTIDDEEEHLQALRQVNALFTYAERTLCTCAQCAPCFIAKQNKTF